MIRTVLSDEQWARIAGDLPGKVGDPGRSGENNRLFVEAVLWIVRTGSPWRDLPDEFGKWYSVYTRFWRWARKGVWESLFNKMAEDPDFEYVMIDGTIVRVHQHGAGVGVGATVAEAVVDGAGQRIGGSVRAVSSSAYGVVLIGGDGDGGGASPSAQGR